MCARSSDFLRHRVAGRKTEASLGRFTRDCVTGRTEFASSYVQPAVRNAAMVWLEYESRR